MEVFGDITALIDQLNDVDRRWSFSSMEIGTCFTIRILDLHANRVLINVKGETTEKSYSIPIILKKLITTNLYRKTFAEELKPIIEYLGKVKHKKIDGGEYHNFKVVNILSRDGEEVINSESATTTTTTTS